MIPLSDAIDRWVRCPDPDCGAPSLVEKSRHRAAPAGGMPGPPGSASASAAPAVAPRVQWAIVRCPRGGAKLWPGHTMVEVYDG